MVALQLAFDRRQPARAELAAWEAEGGNWAPVLQPVGYLPARHRCSEASETRALNCAPRLPSGVGSSVESIVASFYSHQPAQAEKAEQSDPAIVVMIIPVSPTSIVGRAGR